MSNHILKQKWYYGPVFLKDKPTTIGADLNKAGFFVRCITLVENDKGRTTSEIYSDYIEYPTDDAMVEAIERLGMEEMPDKADTEPMWVPDGLKGHTKKKVSVLKESADSDAVQ